MHEGLDTNMALWMRMVATPRARQEAGGDAGATTGWQQSGCCCCVMCVLLCAVYCDLIGGKWRSRWCSAYIADSLGNGWRMVVSDGVLVMFWGDS